MDSEGNNLNLVTGDYIAGLTARIHFYIKLRQDDLPILQSVKNTLGFGHINYQPETRSNHSPCYRYEVSDRQELHQLMQFFDHHPLISPKKMRDKQRIETILTIIDSGDHLTETGLARIRQIKQEMHN